MSDWIRILILITKSGMPLWLWVVGLLTRFGSLWWDGMPFGKQEES